MVLFADYRSVPALAAMSPMQAAMHLLEQAGVATVPGDNFYASGREGDRYLRSPSAARSRRCRKPSNGFVPGSANGWQSPDRLRAPRVSP